ncbi:MAG: HEAT repeat domain-containing protein, partial [Thermoleophilia bacterium]
MDIRQLEEMLARKRFGEVSKLLYQHREEAVRELIRLLDTSDDETQRGILNVLGRYGFDHPEDVFGHTGTIMKLLDDNPGLKSEGVCALGNLVFNYRNKSEEVLPILRVMLNEPDPFIRQDAAYAIGNIGFNFPDLVEDQLP